MSFVTTLTRDICKSMIYFNNVWISKEKSKERDDINWAWRRYLRTIHTHYWLRFDCYKRINRRTITLSFIYVSRRCWYYFFVYSIDSVLGQSQILLIHESTTFIRKSTENFIWTDSFMNQLVCLSIDCIFMFYFISFEKTYMRCSCDASFENEMTTTWLICQQSKHKQCRRRWRKKKKKSFSFLLYVVVFFIHFVLIHFH